MSHTGRKAWAPPNSAVTRSHDPGRALLPGGRTSYSSHIPGALVGAGRAHHTPRSCWKSKGGFPVPARTSTREGEMAGFSPDPDVAHPTLVGTVQTSCEGQGVTGRSLLLIPGLRNLRPGRDGQAAALPPDLQGRTQRRGPEKPGTPTGMAASAGSPSSLCKDTRLWPESHPRRAEEAEDGCALEPRQGRTGALNQGGHSRRRRDRCA